MSAPIENKVSVGTMTAALTGAVSWVLVTYVPSFHSGIPAPLQAFIPVLIAAVSAFAGGYLAKHTVRADEIIGAIQAYERQAHPVQTVTIQPGHLQFPGGSYSAGGVIHTPAETPAGTSTDPYNPA
jgi:hypothetical protein